MKLITPQTLDQMGAQGQATPRRRANHNLHEQLPDPIQRLAIAMEPDTYVRPHRHPHTWELLYPLRGRFVVLHFDERGVVINRTLLGTDSAVVETPAGVWHAVLSLDVGGVIFEVKHGPYMPIAPEDYTTWSPAEGRAEAVSLNQWYAQARPGDAAPR